MTERSAVLGLVAHNLLLDAVAAEVVGVLRTAGVEPVLLKGPATVRWVYPDEPTVRRYSDVDLLVPPDRYAAACVAVGRTGFVRQVPGRGVVDDRDVNSSSWVRGRGEVLDLHRSFHEVGDARAFWRVVSGSATNLELAGDRVRAPDAAGTALICALHACSNGLDLGHAAKSLADLRRAVAILDLATWREASRRAEQIGSTAAFAVGLRLDEQGCVLADALGLSPEAPPSVLLNLHRPSSGGDLTLRRFLDGSPAVKARLARNLLLPSRETLAAQPGGSWGLGVAYVRRLGHVVAQTPPALRRRRAATREAELSGWDPGRRRPRTAVSTAVRLARDPDRLRTAWWAVRSVRAARHQLSTRGPDEVVLPNVPVSRGPAGGHGRTLRRTAALLGATCLESALLRQRWLLAGGETRDLVIGVTSPREGFRAHAWLDGDAGAEGFTELHRHRAQLPRLPDFVVIGAPKTGSTSLYHYLRAHPQVFMSVPKEPEFFSDERAWRRGAGGYRSLFAAAGADQVVGEASVRYATAPPGPVVAARMARVLPDAKLVYVVREPVSRMVSQWQHNRIRLAERRPLADALRTGRYVDNSRYADRLAPFLEHYPAERLHVVVAERLRDDRGAELRRLFEFLGVDPDAPLADVEQEFNRTTDKRTPRPWFLTATRLRGAPRAWRAFTRRAPAPVVRAVHRATHEPARPVILDDDTVAQLRALFADDVARLRPLVAPPFEGWGLA